MRVGILSEFCLASSHGSGAQMLRIIDRAPLDYFHVYWSTRPFGLSAPGRHSHLFEDPLFWRPLRFNRAMAKLHAAIGLRGWHGTALNTRLFDRLVPKAQVECDVIYAFATSEGSAAQCLALVEHLGKPCVVHIMDVQHEDGLDPATMPGFDALLRRAASVLVINEAIEREVRRFSVREVEVVPFCQTVYALPSQTLSTDGPQRVAVVGAIHHRGLDMLAEAWPRVVARFPRAELVYAGRQIEDFPATLRPHVRDLGFVTGQPYLDLLHGSQVGYVPGPVDLGCYGRFSIPSRLADFCMAGLPVIACVAQESAAEIFLRPVQGDFVQIPTHADALVEQFASWLGNDARRAEAGTQARRFAETHLSSATVAQTVVAHLRAACHLPEPAPALRG